MTEQQASALREQFNLMRHQDDAWNRKASLEALAVDAPIFSGTSRHMFLSTPERTRALLVCKSIGEVRDFEGKAVRCEVLPSATIPGAWEVTVLVKDDLDVSILLWRLRKDGAI